MTVALLEVTIFRVVAVAEQARWVVLQLQTNPATAVQVLVTIFRVLRFSMPAAAAEDPPLAEDSVEVVVAVQAQATGGLARRGQPTPVVVVVVDGCMRAGPAAPAAPEL
jgi:hypothetical protein